MEMESVLKGEYPFSHPYFDVAAIITYINVAELPCDNVYITRLS